MAEQAELAVWWLRMAVGDLADARAILAAEGAPRRGSAYLAQQSAEKALKAAILAVGLVPPKAHDLTLLASLVPALFDAAGTAPDLTRLSAAIVTARYPDPDDPPYDVDELAQLLSDAENVIDNVTDLLTMLGLDAADVDAV